MSGITIGKHHHRSLSAAGQGSQSKKKPFKNKTTKQYKQQQ